ncbi:MAG: site-2 protease family protein [Planctomycetota bacterium]
MESLPDLFRIPAVVLGIGLVIFVHELGHFIAARLCGVRVVTFSLGFGPKLFGWRRGSTLYQIAAFPLGGYVRMAGDEPRERDQPPLPDELPAKSVGQRFFIYSGGVAMNVVFALVVFPILFQVGVPFQRPVVGDVTPGGPAWQAGIPVGHEIAKVNGTEVFDFGHVLNAVALGDSDDVRLVLRDPATGVETLHRLAAEQNETLGLPMIGVEPGVKRAPDGGLMLAVHADSAAARAGLSDADRIVDVVGGTPGESLRGQLALPMLRGEALELVVEGPEGRRTVTVEPARDPERPDLRIGIQPPARGGAAVRGSARTLGLRVGDDIMAIDGEPLESTGDLARLLDGRTGEVRFMVERAGEPFSLTTTLPTPDAGRALARDLAIGLDLDTTVVTVFPNAPASLAGLRTGDRILSINGVEVTDWDDTVRAVERARSKEAPLVVRIERSDETGTAEYRDVSVPPQHRPALDYGFSFQADTYIYQTESLGEAVRVGALCSWRFLEDAWLTLKRMLTRQVSPKNMGGILMISAVSYEVAAAGLAKLFFFLCLLSMNLAFVNVLPIPLLDGGHLFFLLIEKIKGSPVSDRVLGYSQMVGVVLILSLMVYVTYNDFVRVFGG